MDAAESTIPAGRAKLAAVVRSAGDVILTEHVAKELRVPRQRASKILARWTAQGWLRRVGPGAYVAASLDSLGEEHVLDDPWILVPALFDPAYIGGRTAAEYWDLTEQLFRDIVVITAQPVRKKTLLRHGASFSLKHKDQASLFGTKSVWRHQTKVQVSDVHRTIIDMLDDPALGGGIQHVTDCLSAYARRDDRDFNKLIDYAVRLGNGAVFKRLGFLAQHLEISDFPVEGCLAQLTAGKSKLDPALPCPRISTKWRLWIPESFVRKASRD